MTGNKSNRPIRVNRLMLSVTAAVIIGLGIQTLWTTSSDQGDIRETAASLLTNGKITSIEKTPLNDLYQVEVNNSEILYMDSDGDHFLTGDLYQSEASGAVNLSERHRRGNRMEQLNEFSQKGVISYKAENEKIRLSVFSDIDCPYCQRFHKNIDDYLNSGISIDYYAFPRSGPDTPSFRKFEEVLCSSDRQKALDEAMAGDNPSVDGDCDNPVKAHFELGEKLGVAGTPSLISDDGQMIRGLAPPKAVLRRLGVQ